jgi:hypothetical protein
MQDGGLNWTDPTKQAGCDAENVHNADKEILLNGAVGFSRDGAGGENLRETVGHQRDVGGFEGLDALRAGMLHVEKELLWLIQMIEISSGLYDEWTSDMLSEIGW